jgi:hypothetical protein
MGVFAGLGVSLGTEIIMLKELFPFAFTADEDTSGRDGRPNSREGPPEHGKHDLQPEARAAQEVAKGPFASFEEVYRGAPVKSSKAAYTILKVSEMVTNAYLGGMSADAKRNSILMALEAAGVSVDDLLQDAMVRQRALNDYEETLQRRLKEFETRKLEENRQVQNELDRLTAEHIGRIQSNLDELARQQDVFRVWQKDKQQESRHISDAASICVPQNAPSKGDSASLMLERVTGSRH